ncbi:hypothetical protein [Nocardioides perillae]|uniref:Uncharacterized protein n=1 Tax=Nocardioides perillae TaxID=1119534 RepID=A0A7Y9RTA7_9ACTN|nr:hypothetical protein [Nocardioides perillae]NYG54263.1 hypothetical protein [Nocardioides perillae]
MRAPRGLPAALLALSLTAVASCSGAGGGEPGTTDPAPAPGTPARAEAPASDVDWSPAPRTVDGLSVLAESDADGFRLHTASGEKTFLPGVNLGSSTPLHQPGEVGTIEAEQYRDWLATMGRLGSRVVRVYTLHPPAFYDELAAYNEAHPEAPLYLAQGVYLPDESYVEPGGTLYDPVVDEAFSAELADVSAAVHGDLEREQRPGRAGGTYTTDVSPWLASWVLGVEWDPAGVLRTDARHADTAYAPGRFFAATADATATERWIATHLDELAALEAARGSSVPVAFVNWPTTDPLDHPEEPLPEEDAASVDPVHVLPTDAWPGGTFASFHAYPYYPDFQRYEPGLQDEQWDGEGDPYAGYVVRLREHSAEHMPLLVTETGVPSSLGSAHVGTRGRDQGGHEEVDAMTINADLVRLAEDKGAAAAWLFAFEDEWFKRTWNTQLHQVPERRQLWHDPLTNEQWFGLLSTDAEPIPDAAAEVLPEAMPADGPFEYLYAWADASWVHLEVTFRDAVPEALDVEADVVPGPEAADYRVLVRPGEGTATAEVRRDLDPVRLDVTPGQRGPYRPGAEEPWHTYALMVNRPLVVQGVQRPEELQVVDELREGAWEPGAEDRDSLATWQVDEERRTVRLRLPWSMLGMADPSSRTALGEGVPAELVEVPGMRLTFTAAGSGGAAASQELDFRWPTWNTAPYSVREKDGLQRVADAFRDVAP